MLIAMLVSLLVLGAALALGGRGVNRTARRLAIWSAPGMITLAVIALYVLGLVTFGGDDVRAFVARSQAAQTAGVMATGLGFFAPLTTLAAAVLAWRTRDPLPSYARAIVALSALGAAAYWTYLVYFITHFAI